MVNLLTCTLDSGRLIFRATSSRIKMSGYRVLPNSDSSTSNWARVNVVLSRLCLRGLTPRGKTKKMERRSKQMQISYKFKKW